MEERLTTTTYYIIHTPCYILHTTYYILTYYLLLTTYYLLLTTSWMIEWKRGWMPGKVDGERAGAKSNSQETLRSEGPGSLFIALDPAADDSSSTSCESNIYLLTSGSYWAT